ncbi:MAG: hypothetical protein IJR17_03365 [Clostridia bacterium]|nr:hypothetical protein [Clostridia bacterium]
MNSPRKEALLALVDVVEDGAYANLRLKDVHQSPQELPFISALVYTALEHLNWADYMLAFYVKPQKKTVRNILRLALGELFFMDTPAHAAVNGAVNLCKECGKGASAGLVNGVLRRMLREKESLPPLPSEDKKRLEVLYTCPGWLLDEWLPRFGLEGTERLLQYKAPALEVRAQYPYRNEDLERELSVAFTKGQVDNNCYLLTKGISLTSWPLYIQGKVAVQGQGAMAVCRFMGDMAGKRVLDACAAPGGKSAYLFSLTRGNIALTSWELHPHRLQLMEEAFFRLGVKATCQQMDAAHFQGDIAPFDGVLLDVPCSGLGLLGNKPDVFLHRKEQDILDLARVQRELLDSCEALVAPGGVLVYSTCTISRRENEEQIESFLRRHPVFTLEEQRQLLPQADGTGGFYMARMRRCI